MNLRDYQTNGLNEIITALSTNDSVCYVLPTRGGKSPIIMGVAIYFLLQKKRVLFLAHTNILLNQIEEDFKKYGVKTGRIQSGYPTNNELLQIASKDTLINRLDQFQFDIILHDEAHMGMGKTFLQVFNHYRCKIVGFTATPIRLDGQKLFYEKYVFGLKMKELQRRGILSKIKYYAPVELDLSGVSVSCGEYNQNEVLQVMQKSTIYGDCVKWYNGDQTLVFCVNCNHARLVCQRFVDAGVPAAYLTGANFSQSVLDDFIAGKIKVLCSVNLFIMGLTIRKCGTIMLMRPTRSTMVFMQSIGRGMIADKEYLRVVDLANNARLHGHPEDVEIDPMGSGRKRKQKEDYPGVRRCLSCFSVYKGGLSCPFCGYENQKKKSELKQEEREFALIEAGKRKEKTKDVKKLIARAHSVQEAVKIAVDNGYKAGYGIVLYKRVFKK